MRDGGPMVGPRRRPVTYFPFLGERKQHLASFQILSSHPLRVRDPPLVHGKPRPSAPASRVVIAAVSSDLCACLLRLGSRPQHYRTLATDPPFMMTTCIVIAAILALKTLVLTRLQPGTWTDGGLHSFVNAYYLLTIVPALYLMQPAFAAGSKPQLVGTVVLAVACRHGIRITPSEAALVARIYLGLLLPVCFTSLLTLLLWPSPLLVVLATTLALALRLGLCMSLALHRYAAHAAFKCAWPTNLLLGIIGCLAFQGGPLWWAAKHRAHHTYCDADSRDPHSPLQHGTVNAFMFFLTGKTSLDRQRMQAVDEEFVPSHCDSVGMRLIDSFSWVWPILDFCVAFIAFGHPGLYVSFTSAWLCASITQWFNVRNHLPADEASCRAKRCAALDVVAPGCDGSSPFFRMLGLIVSTLAPLVGEDKHDHHHTHPSLARRPGLDFPYAVCAALASAGLIWNAKV